MKQITIFAGEKQEIEFTKNSKNLMKQERISFDFKDFLNKYLKRQLPDFPPKETVIITEIKNWELIKVYRAVLNINHNNFILIVNYNEDDLINTYL